MKNKFHGQLKQFCQDSYCKGPFLINNWTLNMDTIERKIFFTKEKKLLIQFFPEFILVYIFLIYPVIVLYSFP